MARTQGAGPQAAPLCALHSVLLQKVLLPARAALCTYSAFVSSFYTPLSKSENKGARSRKSPALFSRFVALKPTKQNKHTHPFFSEPRCAERGKPCFCPLLFKLSPSTEQAGRWLSCWGDAAGRSGQTLVTGW
jgi:hypothetical protein